MAFRRLGFARSDIKISFLQLEWHSDAMNLLAKLAKYAKYPEYDKLSLWRFHFA
jgi:hypothetical protein